MSHSKAKTPSTIAKRQKQSGTEDNVDTDDAMYKIFQFSSDTKDVPTGPRPKETVERGDPRFPGLT